MAPSLFSWQILNPSLNQLSAITRCISIHLIFISFQVRAVWCMKYVFYHSTIKGQLQEKAHHLLGRRLNQGLLGLPRPRSLRDNRSRHTEISSNPWLSVVYISASRLPCSIVELNAEMYITVAGVNNKSTWRLASSRRQSTDAIFKDI